MRMSRAIRAMTKATQILEYLICLLLSLGVLLSAPDLVKYLVDIVTKPYLDSYILLGEFLRHALLMVAGIELIILIITHSNQSLLTLVLFVIARKMLVYADSMLDIFIGSLAIAVTFIILKFLIRDEKMMASYDHDYSASIPLKKLRLEHGIDLPNDMQMHTLGGLIYQICQDQQIPIEENSVICFHNYEFQITSAEDGVIRRVHIDQHGS